MSAIELKEVIDGLLVSPDKVMMKAREPGLFPENVRLYFSDKIKVSSKEIEAGLDKIIIRTSDKRAVFDSELFEYVKSHGRIDYFLSNIPLPGETGEFYPLFAKYKHGWVVLSPLEA